MLVKYADGLKARAVELVIHAQADSGQVAPTESVDLEAENRRLRAELAEASRANEILKKIITQLRPLRECVDEINGHELVGNVVRFGPEAGRLTCASQVSGRFGLSSTSEQCLALSALNRLEILNGSVPVRGLCRLTGMAVILRRRYPNERALHKDFGIGTAITREVRHRLRPNWKYSGPAEQSDSITDCLPPKESTTDSAMSPSG